MRKWYGLLLILLALLVIQPVGAEQIKLRVATWLSSQAESEIYERWATEYSQANPNVEVQFEPGPFDKMLTMVVAGVGPDIMRVSRNDFASMAENQLIKPIPTEWLSDIKVNDLFPAIRAQGTYKGQLYGWDPHLGVLLMHYNRYTFDNAGVAYPNNTWTWDSLTQAAKKLTRRDPDGKNNIWGFHINYSNPSHLWLIHTWTQGSEAFGADNKPLFPSPATIKALSYLRELVVEVGVSSPTNTGFANLFRRGEAAMIIAGTWQNITYEGLEAVDHGTAIIPRGAQPATSANLHLWAMASATKYPKETWELFKFWVGVKNSLEFTDYGGVTAQGLPVWRQALRDPKWRVSPVLQPALEIADYAKPLPFIPGIGPWFPSTEKVMRQVFFENKPVLEALEEMAHQANTAFTEAGAYK